MINVKPLYSFCNFMSSVLLKSRQLNMRNILFFFFQNTSEAAGFSMQVLVAPQVAKQF